VVSDPNLFSNRSDCIFASGILYFNPAGQAHDLMLGWNLQGTLASLCDTVPIGNTLLGGDGVVKATVVGGAPPAQQIFGNPISVSDSAGTVAFFSLTAAAFNFGPQTSQLYAFIPDHLEDRNGNRVTFSQGSAQGAVTGCR